jgi:hypothetical protein
MYETIFKIRESKKEARSDTYPLNATTHRAPLVGSLRKAKSREGSHISVSVFGRYPPIEYVRLFVICIDLLRRIDLQAQSVSID